MSQILSGKFRFAFAQDRQTSRHYSKYMRSMASAAYIHVNQMYMLMKIKHVTNKRFLQILSPQLNTSDRQLDKSYQFCLQEEEGIEKEE